MDKQEILNLIDERATELETEAYHLGEDLQSLKAERKSEQAKALRRIQKEIRNG